MLSCGSYIHISKSHTVFFLIFFKLHIHHDNTHSKASSPVYIHQFSQQFAQRLSVTRWYMSQHFSVDLVGTYKKAIKGYKRGQADVPTRIEQKVGYTDTASF